MPTEGGKEIQLTRNGGAGALESPDGKSIYYYTLSSDALSSWESRSIRKMPLSGGEESQVLPSVLVFSLVKEGIYFIPPSSLIPGPPFRKSSIQFLSFVTGEVKTVAPTSAPFGDLSFSPDGFLLFSQIDQVKSDLMLVENFR